MKHLGTRFYVFSTDAIGRTDAENQVVYDETACELALEGVGFIECAGTFEGRAERCYLVPGRSVESTVSRVCAEAGQASYLVVTEDTRDAYLVAPGSEYHKHLGRWREVSSPAAFVNGAGTTFPGDGDAPDRHFTCAPYGALVDLPGGF